MKIIRPALPPHIGEFPQTDEEAIEYLPDHDEQTKELASNLFRCYRGMGHRIDEALGKVLEACLGINPRKD